MIRRKKTTIFLDAKDSIIVSDLKKQLKGLTKQPPEGIRLFKDEEEMRDDKALSDYNFSSARAQTPATVGMAYKVDGGTDFESLEIGDLSSPPELPDVMKPQENSPHATEPVAS